MLRRSALAFLLLAGCSSSNFQVPEGTAGPDGSSTETSVPGDTGAPADTAAPGDTGNSDDVAVAVDGGGGGCAAESDPANIYVDASKTFPSPTGTSTCPFAHITDALAYAKTLPAKARTLRVAVGEYAESAAVILPKGITLLGAGPKTVIAGGGNCYGTGYPCVVRIDAGATLDGVTVDASPGAKQGIILGNADTVLATARNLAVRNAEGDGSAGVLVMSGGVLGPNLESTNNRYGLTVWGSHPVKIIAGANKFDANSHTGINIEGTGVVTFEGGSVSGNAAGIRLGPSPTEPTLPPLHDFRKLVAKDNVEFGIRIAASHGLKLRDSTITGGKVGIIAIFGATNRVDLGRTDDKGNNNFGSTTTKSTMAAVCALGTGALPMPAVGNSYPNCLTKQALGMTGGCESIPSYADIWWRGVSEPDGSSCVKTP